MCGGYHISDMLSSEDPHRLLLVSSLPSSRFQKDCSFKTLPGDRNLMKYESKLTLVLALVQQVWVPATIPKTRICL